MAIWGLCGSSHAMRAPERCPVESQSGVDASLPLCDAPFASLLAAKNRGLVVYFGKWQSHPSFSIISSRRNIADTHKHHKCTQPHNYMALQTRAVVQV